MLSFSKRRLISEGGLFRVALEDYFEEKFGLLTRSRRAELSVACVVDFHELLHGASTR